MLGTEVREQNALDCFILFHNVDVADVVLILAYFLVLPTDSKLPTASFGKIPKKRDTFPWFHFNVDEVLLTREVMLSVYFFVFISILFTVIFTGRSVF